MLVNQNGGVSYLTGSREVHFERGGEEWVEWVYGVWTKRRFYVDAPAHNIIFRTHRQDFVTHDKIIGAS